jgi:hypothetical protein
MSEGASDFTHFCLAVRRLTEKAGKQGNKGHADESDTAARHELLHALALRTGVVISVTFHEVHDTPDCETCAQGDNESLKNTYCAVEKCHIPNLPESCGSITDNAVVSGLQKPERTASAPSWLLKPPDSGVSFHF